MSDDDRDLAERAARVTMIVPWRDLPSPVPPRGGRGCMVLLVAVLIWRLA